MVEPPQPLVLVGGAAGAGAAAPAAAAQPHLAPAHAVDPGHGPIRARYLPTNHSSPGGQLDRVQRLGVVRGLGGDVGQQRHLPYMSLTVKN